MQLKILSFATVLLASASAAMSATITGFAGADCTGTKGQSINVPSGECVSFGGGSAKSINYSGVTHEIEFFISGGSHDFCTNGATLIFGVGSGCATAPPGLNWDSVAIV